MNDNTPRERPAAYDAQVVAYQPFIRRLANKAYRNGNADDLAQEITMEALRRWRVYSDRYKFGTWLVQVARNVVAAAGKRSATKMRAGKHISINRSGVEDSRHNAAPPSQDDYAELSAVLRRVSGTRDGEALVRIAMGEELSEIAAEFGVSRERVRQLAERGRARLREEVA